MCASTLLKFNLRVYDLLTTGQKYFLEFLWLGQSWFHLNSLVLQVFSVLNIWQRDNGSWAEFNFCCQQAHRSCTCPLTVAYAFSTMYFLIQWIPQSNVAVSPHLDRCVCNACRNKIDSQLPCVWCVTGVTLTVPMRPIRHRSHNFATQSSHFVDRARWQAKNGFHWIMDTPPPPSHHNIMRTGPQNVTDIVLVVMHVQV